MQYSFLLFVFFFCSCISSSKNNVRPVEDEVLGFSTPKKDKKLKEHYKPNIPSCDSLKWIYTYDPERLKILQACKTVTGTIRERDSNEDGDEHMLLKLDKGQGDLLKKKNISKKEGCLVIEAVCVNKPTAKKAKKTCKGYINNVQLPRVGDHVQVTGSYVLDTHNGCTEIHPVTSIRKMK
jgi:hypothetical protein